MGAANSSLSELSSNEYLKRFVSSEVLTFNDPFWNQLLSYSVKLPNTITDGRLLEECCQDLFKSLLHNNIHTGNLSSLLQVFLARSTELKASAQLQKVFIWQTFNALYLLRCVIKLLLETLSEDEVIATLQIPSPHSLKSGKNKEDLSNLVESFTSSLVEIIVDVPLSELTYDLHVEATSTLIVLISSHIFAVGAAPRHIMLRTLLNGKPAIHACLLVKTLMKRVMSRELPPGSGEGGSIILGIASGLWNVLTLGISAEDEKHPEDALPRLATQSLILALILVNHFTSEKAIQNPYRIALLSAQNFQDPADNVPTQAVATFKMEYATLYATLCGYLSTDQVTLLLYVLLHKNSDFRTYVLARTDIESLVLPILKTLYNAPDSTSHHIYMSLIILLILSEDDSFNKSIHDITLKDIAWYTERPISQISLGGLLILVVIRTITFNMTKMRDKYLHTNCLAALANMSSQFRSLHPYVCQRIVNLFETLAKRHSKLCEALRQPSEILDSSEMDISDVMSDISVLEEVLRMVLEIMNSTLTHQLPHNHNLIYTLLYKRHLFELFSSHPSFADVTQNIEVILNYLMSRLETKTSDPSVGDVQEIIKEGVLQLPRERLKKFPELRFKYVEENEPEEFFIPYVWTLVYHSSGMYWNSSKITLFDPHPSER